MSWKDLPLKLEEITKEERDSLSTRKTHFEGRHVRTSPGGIFLPYAYVGLANHIYNFEFRSDDVLMSVYPKCGTTWTGEIVWAMIHFEDIDSMDKTHISSRAFNLDSDFLAPISIIDNPSRLKTFREKCPEGRVEDGVVLQLAKAEEKPRILKTHLQFQFLNPDLLNTCKVVYVARNPKDACVSYYHFLKNKLDTIVTDNFSEYVEDFMNSKTLFSPYWGHLKQAWNLRDHPNLHFMFYEDMKTDIMEELKKLRTFLNKDLTDEQLKKVAEFTSFNSMKSRDQKQPNIAMKSSFFRKGTVGDWKNHSTPELDAKMDRWIEMNSKGMGINFKYSC